MTVRERMLRKLSGSGLDDLLFVPRLDIWYNANKAQGLLPDRYRNYTLDQVLEDLGLGYHSVIPDFTHTGDVSNLHHRALGGICQDRLRQDLMKSSGSLLQRTAHDRHWQGIILTNFAGSPT